jgi:hypothetical protein
MIYGIASSVGKLKDDTICGSMATYVASAIRRDRIAGVVRPSKTYQSKQMRTGIARGIGVIPATRATSTHTGEIGTLMSPMQARD